MVKGNEGAGLLQVHPNLVMNNLWVEDIDEGPLGQEVVDQGNRSRLARITGVSFERKAKNSDPLNGSRSGYGPSKWTRSNTNLAGNGVEKGVNNTLREPPLLVLVHFDNLPPVCSNLR